MCSIAGWVADPPLPPDLAERLATALLAYGEPRGDQSAGIYFNGKIVKRAMSPSKFINIKAFTKLLSEPAPVCLLHTRWPTSGGREDTDAQPFEVGSTVAVHNGCISNCKELKKKFGLTKHTSKVDSELIAAYIEQYSPEGLPDFLTAVTGPSAVAAIKDGNVYLARDINPIEYLEVKLNAGGILTVFASTEHQLLNSLRYNWLLGNSVRTRTLLPGQLHRLEASGLTPIGERKPIVYGTSGYSATGYGRGWRDDYDADDGYWRGQHYHRRKDNDKQGVPKATDGPAPADQGSTTEVGPAPVPPQATS